MKTSKIITLMLGIVCLLLLINSCDSNTTKPNPVTGISLNQTILDMPIGTIRILRANITPENATNKDIIWTSTNNSIVTVTNTGVISSLSLGSATIIATTQDGGFTAMCNVSVYQEPTATVIINLSTSDGGSVIGATVVLQNHVGGAFQETATSSSVIFTNIPFGLHSVIVSHSGYQPFIDETLSVQSHTVSHAVQLINSQIGTIISFGNYNWRVLDIQSGQALIVSENIIEQRVYHNSNTGITWAGCSLRAYLNDDFYNSSAFSNEDRSRIVQVTNVNLNNQWYGTNGGVNTQDMIFILSIAEVVQYFGDSGHLANQTGFGNGFINDEYNSNRIATFNGSDYWWWLRSPGDHNLFVSYVSHYGHIYMPGGDVNHNHGGVRPALWLNL